MNMLFRCFVRLYQLLVSRKCKQPELWDGLAGCWISQRDAAGKFTLEDISGYGHHGRAIGGDES